MLARVRHEFMKVERPVHITQIVMKKDFIGVFRDSFSLRSEGGSISVRLKPGFAEKFQKASRLFDLLGRVRKVCCVKTNNASLEIM